MSTKSQYKKMINTLCFDAYKCIDDNYVHSLDALNIPHIFGNVIADLPENIHIDVIKYIIECSIRDLKKYGLIRIFFIASRAKTSRDDPQVNDFFIVTKQAPPDSLTDNDQLLNTWRQEGCELTTQINVIFCDEANYLARKAFCVNGRCEVEYHTGVKCEENKCFCFPSLAQHQGVQLLFIDVND